MSTLFSPNELAEAKQTYLQATERQRDPKTSIKEWLELDIKREAVLTQIALIKGFIQTIPADGLLATKDWAQTIDFIHQINA
ncbi:hypothetical protein [Pseudanabaena sp. 'Roaring Creek']|uniref:hypothetical protein n=1 Tax=Pseudanabaena sp. 'Roaring Creek' TaxID=1681830 RepID=UPI0006D7A0A8|nr:hypothetical protein [Pseudanabaena sp. 'Roaring Creek']